jgi:hypothetical protein
MIFKMVICDFLKFFSLKLESPMALVAGKPF